MIDTMSHPLDLEARRLLAELCDRFPIERAPTLEWRDYRTTAGTAHYDRWAIALSRRLMTDSARLRDTLLHEYAHLLAFHRAGKAGRGHGPAWRRAMQDLGLSPDVAHRYECRRNRPRRRVIYACRTCGTEIVRLRLLPRRRQYIHAGCGGGIAFVRVELLVESLAISPPAARSS
jgi:predicted SprT family Zn-dependent metalloprotease